MVYYVDFFDFFFSRLRRKWIEKVWQKIVTFWCKVNEDGLSRRKKKNKVFSITNRRVFTFTSTNFHQQIFGTQFNKEHGENGGK